MATTNDQAPQVDPRDLKRDLLVLNPLQPAHIPSPRVHPKLLLPPILWKNTIVLSQWLHDILYEKAQEQLDVPRKKIGTSKDYVQDRNGKKHAVVVEKWKTHCPTKTIQGQISEDGMTWFGRTSEHAEELVEYEKLEHCLMRNHEKNEMEYTEGIYDVNTILDWKTENLEEWIRHEHGNGALGGIGDWPFWNVEMRITEMHHTMPGGGLLADRVFTVLLVSFQNKKPPHPFLAESLNVQIPLDLSALPEVLQAHSHIRTLPDGRCVYRNLSPDATPIQVQKSKAGKEVVRGRYVSVERIRKVEVEGEARTVTRWEMKTASDAGGKLPMWAQKLGVPGAIVKDVEGALRYCINKD